MSIPQPEASLSTSYSVATIPIPCGRSLRPEKNKGGGSFDKVVDQNFPLFFTRQTIPLTKLSP